MSEHFFVEDKYGKWRCQLCAVTADKVPALAPRGFVLRSYPRDCEGRSSRAALLDMPGNGKEG